MIHHLRKNKKHAGFTLVELVVVIVVIGLLAAMALPKLGNLTTEAQTAKTDYAAAATASRTECQAVATAAGKPADFCGTGTYGK